METESELMPELHSMRRRGHEMVALPRIRHVEERWAAAAVALQSSVLRLSAVTLASESISQTR